MSSIENDFEVPELSVAEQEFLREKMIDPELQALYEQVRARILLFGHVEARVTREYINFKYPYSVRNYYTRQKEEKMGTLVNIHFRKNSLAVAFNSLKQVLNDPQNILRPTTSLGVCNYYAVVNEQTNLNALDGVICQAIYCISKKARIVRIHNRYVTIGPS